ncbi:hypothetical protein ACFLSX_00610 [Calditrichota bacterium]
MSKKNKKPPKQTTKKRPTTNQTTTEVRGSVDTESNETKEKGKK